MGFPAVFFFRGDFRLLAVVTAPGVWAGATTEMGAEFA